MFGLGYIWVIFWFRVISARSSPGFGTNRPVTFFDMVRIDGNDSSNVNLDSELLVPLHEVDAAPLQQTLYRDFPAFYRWMLQKKDIEEAFATLEYDRKFGHGEETKYARCENGFCNVASGGFYLCPPVLQGIRSVVHVGGPVCVVGSGSFATESWLLHTTTSKYPDFQKAGLLNNFGSIK